MANTTKAAADKMKQVKAKPVKSEVKGKAIRRSKIKMSKAKLKNLQANANRKGVIAAAAMDQRGSLQKSIEKLGGDSSPKGLSEFKSVVTDVLTPHATAILLDPEYGLKAATYRHGKGLLLAYELSGYDNAVPGRIPDLLPNQSVRRLAEAGATGVKVLLYYNAFDDKSINDRKHAFIERIGAECDAVGLPFFLEPLAYDDKVGEDKGFEFAKVKPKHVIRYMEEFSKEKYNVDILKVEFPFNANFTEGYATGEQIAYSQEDAMKHTRDAASVAAKPYIYLSAGVDMGVFAASVEIAGRANTSFSGVLCGRATWKNGIPIYAKEGKTGLRKWLKGEGVDNINILNKALAKYAKPWWNIYGGQDRISVI
jgi:tagatose 1,6-diphosphate aldolase